MSCGCRTAVFSEPWVQNHPKRRDIWGPHFSCRNHLPEGIFAEHQRGEFGWVYAGAEGLKHFLCPGNGKTKQGGHGKLWPKHP